MSGIIDMFGAFDTSKTLSLEPPWFLPVFPGTKYGQSPCTHGGHIQKGGVQTLGRVHGAATKGQILSTKEVSLHNAR